MLKAWREHLGLNQEDTATLTGVSRSSVARAELGLHFSLRYIIKLANLTGNDYTDALTPETRSLYCVKINS